MRHGLGANMSLMRCHGSQLLQVVDIYKLGHRIDREMGLVLLQVGIRD